MRSTPLELESAVRMQLGGESENTGRVAPVDEDGSRTEFDGVFEAYLLA